MSRSFTGDRNVRRQAWGLGSRPFRRDLSGVLTIVVVVSSCLDPGLRAEGVGSVQLIGTNARTMSGACSIGAEPAWGVRMPWAIRWEDTVSDWRLVIRRSTRPRVGVTTISPAPDNRVRQQALLLEGNTVRGTAFGTLKMAQRGDTVVLSLEARADLRESWDVLATCRAIDRADGPAPPIRWTSPVPGSEDS